MHYVGHWIGSYPSPNGEIHLTFTITLHGDDGVIDGCGIDPEGLIVVSGSYHDHQLKLTLVYGASQENDGKARTWDAEAVDLDASEIRGRCGFGTSSDPSLAQLTDTQGSDGHDDIS